MQKVLISFFTLAILGGSAPAAQVEKYTGKAMRGDRLIYTERHELTRSGSGQLLEAVTLYVDDEGETIAELRSDFKVDLSAPNYTFKDLRTGEVQGVRRSPGPGALVMFSQKKGERERTEDVVADSANVQPVFGGQGLNYYLIENLDKVRALKKSSILFLLPGSLAAYEFTLAYEGQASEKVARFKLEVSNGFLRFFAPSLIMTYDETKKRLVGYEGISNLKNDQGRPQSVKITYDYE
jgi:hypothetical protein